MVMTADLFDLDDSPREPSALISLSPLPIRGETEAVPLHSSPIPDDVDLAPFWVGVALLGLRSVGPQQLEIARLLLAELDGVPLYSSVVIEEPRRASKTTTIWAVLLGLCATRPGFRVVVTAQTYVKARERFLEVYRTLAPRNVGDYEMKRGAAEMNIEWRNGSRLWVVTPEGGAFRGDGADRILFDEAQEHSPETTAELKGAALALMDTRFQGDEAPTDDDMPNGQVIVTGTTGKSRSGMLWDYLERGRRGEIGIIEYAVPEGELVAYPVDEAPDDLPVRTLDPSGRYVLNEPAIRRAHPGVGTLTTMATIRDRFQSMALPQFQREYGGQWPFDLNSRAIDPQQWRDGTVKVHPPKPLRYALGYDVAPDQSSAALCAAWRDQDGIAWWEVIEHQVGDGWLAKSIYQVTRRHPSIKVGYDNIGPNQAVADRLQREARPRPKLVSLGTREITAAAAQVSQDIRARTLRHIADPALDAAAEIATRRPIGDGSWAWGRRRAANEGGDIAPLVAATNALKVFDAESRPTQQRTRIVTRKAS